MLRKYVVDAADQLQQILDLNDLELESFAYDAAGRRTEHRVGGALQRTYDYDGLSRLRRVTSPTSAITTTLAYDAQDARYQRDETGSPTALFFGEWMEYRGNEVVRLVHGGGLDNVLAEVVQGDVRQLLTDASNNVIHVASSAGSTYARRYEAFGGVRSSQNAIPVERGFAARPTEGSTGLLYMRARHYDPATGRFLQTDPLGIVGDQLYAYAASNPLVFGDPLGLSATKIRSNPATQCVGCPGGSFDVAGPVMRKPAQGRALPRIADLDPSGAQFFLEEFVGPLPRTGVRLKRDVDVVEVVARLRRRNPTIFEFRNLVKNGAALDVKQHGSQFEALGNFLFGAAGASIAIPSQVLLRGAGVAQKISGTSRPEFGHPLGGAPFGDDPIDQLHIRLGIQFFHNNREVFPMPARRIGGAFMDP